MGTQERKGEEEALGKEIYIKCSGTRATETKGGSTRRSRSSGDQELGVRGQGVVDKELSTRRQGVHRQRVWGARRVGQGVHRQRLCGQEVVAKEEIDIVSQVLVI